MRLRSQGNRDSKAKSKLLKHSKYFYVVYNSYTVVAENVFEASLQNWKQYFEGNSSVF